MPSIFIHTILHTQQTAVHQYSCLITPGFHHHGIKRSQLVNYNILEDENVLALSYNMIKIPKFFGTTFHNQMFDLSSFLGDPKIIQPRPRLLALAYNEIQTQHLPLKACVIPNTNFHQNFTSILYIYQRRTSKKAIWVTRINAVSYHKA